jgi:hypothetical protein
VEYLYNILRLEDNLNVYILNVFYVWKKNPICISVPDDEVHFVVGVRNKLGPRKSSNTALAVSYRMLSGIENGKTLPPHARRSPSAQRAWTTAEKIDIVCFFWSHKTHSTQETMDYAYRKYHKTLAASTLSGWKLRFVGVRMTHS